MIRLDSTPRLLVDDRLLDRPLDGMAGDVERRVVPAAKEPEPVLVPTAPWEAQRVYVYGTVLRDGGTGRWRMWYMSRGAAVGRDPALRHTSKDLVLYAESDDGLRWQRPDLGLYEVDGRRDNNTVYDLHSPSVLHDPDDPDPERRYKMLGAAGRSYHAALSADGLRWRDAPGSPVLAHSDTITLSRDPVGGHYLAFHKISTEVRGHRRRVVHLATSPDFDTWSAPRLVLAPDEEDDAWVTEPGQRTEFYNLSAFPVCSGFLGMVTVFRLRATHEHPAPEQSPADGPIDVQLVHSADGRTWQRCADRTAIIANGPHDYDAGCILGVANRLVADGDRVFLYYTAINTTHGGPLPPKRITVARAGWQRDRFVALAARAATLTTAALTLEAPQLRLNADAGGGRITVAALDETGAALPGFAHDDCVPLEADGLDLPVAWRRHTGLPVHRPLRLSLRLRDSRLFAVRAAAPA